MIYDINRNFLNFIEYHLAKGDDKNHSWYVANAENILTEEWSVERIRVLRAIYDLQVGGVQRMMLRSMTALRGYGIETEVCCLRSRGELAEEVESMGFPVHSLEFTSRLDPRGLWRLRTIVKRAAFHIVHAHMYGANIAVNVALLGMKKIKIINNYHSIKPASTRRQELQIRYTSGRVDSFIAVSDTVRDFLISLGLPASKILIIHNGVPVPDSPREFTGQQPNKPLDLLGAGRFVKQKRIWFLVDVIDRCRAKEVPVRLRLVGDGPTKEQIVSMVKQKGLSGFVSFRDFTKDLSGLMETADLFVSSSEREGFANVLLEACAVGRGLILSDISPHRELIGESPAGIILGDDPEQWVETLQSLAHNRLRVYDMGREAYKVAQRFSLANVAAKLAELYQNVLHTSSCT